MAACKIVIDGYNVGNADGLIDVVGTTDGIMEGTFVGTLVGATEGALGAIDNRNKINISENTVNAVKILSIANLKAYSLLREPTSNPILFFLIRDNWLFWCVATVGEGQRRLLFILYF